MISRKLKLVQLGVGYAFEIKNLGYLLNIFAAEQFPKITLIFYR